MSDKLVLNNVSDIIQAAAELESEVQSFCKSVRSSLYSIDRMRELSKMNVSSSAPFQSVSYLDKNELQSEKTYGDTSSCTLHTNWLSNNIDGIAEVFVSAFSAFDTFDYEEVKRIFKSHGLDTSRIETLDFEQDCIDEILEASADGTGEVSDSVGFIGNVFEAVEKITKSKVGKAFGDLSNTFDKVSSVFLAVSTTLEVTSTVYDGYKSGDSVTEIYGDVRADLAGAALEFGAGVGGAAIGSAIGTFICPGVGTAVGAVIGDAVASWAAGKLYEDVNIFGKSIKEHVSDNFTSKADAVVDIISGAGNLAKDAWNFVFG